MLSLVISTVLASAPVPATTQVAVHNPPSIAAQAGSYHGSFLADDATAEQNEKNSADQQGHDTDQTQQQQQQNPGD